MIEIKPSQEIADIRGVEVGKDVVSPAIHTAFDSSISLLRFIDALREVSGKPVEFANSWS